MQKSQHKYGVEFMLIKKTKETMKSREANDCGNNETSNTIDTETQDFRDDVQVAV